MWRCQGVESELVVAGVSLEAMNTWNPASVLKMPGGCVLMLTFGHTHSVRR